MIASEPTEHSIGIGRWVAKKSARIAVAGAALPFVARACGGLRVLTYHRFAEERRSPFSVSGAELEAHVLWLKRYAVPVEIASLTHRIEAGRAHPHVAVTIDDGDPSVWEIAAPVFERHDVPYAVYVVSGRIGQRNHMSAAQLRGLAERGVTVGSHTMTHRSMASLSPAELDAELAGSKKAIEDITGQPCTSFAYPFGTRRHISRRAAEGVRRAGFTLGFTSLHGAVDGQADPLLLPRIKIEGGDPAWMFGAACRGALDAWRLIDEGLSAWQKPEERDLAPAVRRPRPGQTAA